MTQYHHNGCFLLENKIWLLVIGDTLVEYESENGIISNIDHIFVDKKSHSGWSHPCFVVSIPMLCDQISIFPTFAG